MFLKNYKLKTEVQSTKVHLFGINVLSEVDWALAI